MNCSPVFSYHDEPNGSNVGEAPYTMRNKPIHANRHMRVICIGAGASGIYMAYKLKYRFADFTLNIYEKNPEIGGTWYENRYPGCACDVPAFEPKHDWSANYASSKEIFQYFSNFIDKYGLREFITCNREVVGARWLEDTSEWLVQVRRNDQPSEVFEQCCDFLINASGILNNWRWPAIPGLQDCEGVLLHPAAWDENVDLQGKHVGLIGNGSSGIQILPQGRYACHTTREPTWVSPALGMEYHIYSDEEKRSFKEDHGVLLNMRKAAERAISGAFPLLIKGSASQRAAAQHMRKQMETKLNNSEFAQKLIPDFTVGCRRLTPGVNYLESLGLPNITTICGEVANITEKGCVTDDGQETAVDVLICATGFDTTFKPRFPLIGREGKELGREWAQEPRSYLGLAAHGFPNYFIFLGPNCPIGNGPIIFSIEIQGDWMAQFMNRWQKEDIVTFDPKIEAVNDFMEQKDSFMPQTVWDSNCLSWYKDPRSGKITALWPGSTLHYMETLANPRFDDFDIKYLGNRFAYLGNGFSQTELNPYINPSYYIREKDDGQSVCKSLMSTYNAKDVGNKLTDIIEVPV